jgi:hypothetical protein
MSEPEFGAPTRSATTDANEGIVNPPTVKRDVGQVATRQESLSGTEVGVAKFANQLGNVLDQYAAEDFKNTREKKQLAALARQGRKKAINDIDRDKKRSGWQSAIFGEDVEYRAAQQRAVENSVQAAYIEQLTAVDTFAGESPEEYEARLSGSLERMLEDFEGDSDTRQMITNKWSIASGKLAAQHMKEHHAYNQLQQRETTGIQIQQAFDIGIAELSRASSPEDVKLVHDTVSRVFTDALKPQGMSDLAYRSVLQEQIGINLRKGNIGAYNLAKQNGFIDSLNPKEKRALEQSISAYDTQFGHSVGVTVENTKLAVMQAKDEDDAVGIATEAFEALAQHEIRMSQTPRSEDIIATARNQIMRAIQGGFKEASAKELKAQRVTSYKEALRMSDPARRSGAIVQIAGEGQTPKKTELEEAFDSNLIEDIGALAQVEEQLEPYEAVQHLADNPAIARQIAATWKQSDIASPLVKQLAKAYIEGGATMVDPSTHQPTQRAQTISTSLSYFAEDKAKFMQTIGRDDFDRYEITRRGMEMRLTQDQIAKHIENYQKNKGNNDKWNLRWNKAEKGGMNKREYIADLVKKRIGDVPVGSTLTEYMEGYANALVIYNGDEDAAEDYVTDMATSNTVQYRGRAIFNAQHLNNTTDYTLPDLLDGIQQPDINLLSGYLSAMLGDTRDKTGKPATRLDQVPNWSIYTQPGIPGFFLTAPDAINDVRITPEVMSVWGDKLTQDRQFKDMRNRKDIDALKRTQEIERSVNMGIRPF